MKWKPLRAAAVLLVLTALTSNIVCGTLAKYAASASSRDFARVAKWGITVLAEGNLFGENYDGSPTNTVTTNADGGITVKSHQSMTLGNGSTTGDVVAPGTKNETGLVFGISGKAETALQVTVTIKNQNIALRPNIYYILHKVTVTPGNFDTLTAKYGKLYKESGDGFVPAAAFEASETYYYADNEVNLTDRGNWPYCPVVFELNPAQAGTGMTVSRTFNSATPSSGNYRSTYNDKSLDIVSMSMMWCGYAGGSTWPAMDGSDVFSRTISRTFPAGKDLSKITLNELAAYSMENERLTWEWEYQQAENTQLYNMADNILGRLAAEKLVGGLEDDFVVICDRTVGTDTLGHLTFFQKGNDVLIRPVEYTDYCLETLFDMEMTVSQID